VTIDAVDKHTLSSQTFDSVKRSPQQCALQWFLAQTCCSNGRAYRADAHHQPPSCNMLNLYFYFFETNAVGASLHSASSKSVLVEQQWAIPTGSQCVHACTQVGLTHRYKHAAGTGGASAYTIPVVDARASMASTRYAPDCRPRDIATDHAYKPFCEDARTLMTRAFSMMYFPSLYF
jgi:hypothetical protein